MSLCAGLTSTLVSDSCTRAGGHRVFRCARPRKVREKQQEPHGKRVVGVKLIEVIAAGILSPPVRLFRKYKGKVLEATLMEDGTVDFLGTRHGTCSLAADMARSSITGRPMNTNGWEFWQYDEKNGGATQTLSDARNKYLELKGGEVRLRLDAADRLAAYLGLQLTPDPDAKPPEPTPANLARPTLAKRKAK